MTPAVVVSYKQGDLKLERKDKISLLLNVLHELKPLRCPWTYYTERCSIYVILVLTIHFTTDPSLLL